MSVADKLHQRQMALRKKSGLPHPDYYKELGHSYNISDDKERLAKQSEIKKKYKVESVEQLDEMPESSMKTRDVHAHLRKSGWTLKRTGGGHDVYSHPKSKEHIAVPRHKQLKAPLIRGIMKASRVSEETEIEEQLEKKGRFVSGPPKKTFKAPTIVSPIKEAKDAREYDYEGDMAMSQLRSLIFNAEDMIDLMDENTNLPEWVQSKITLAEDYISTAANYLRGELTEAVSPAQQAAIAVSMKEKGIKPKVGKQPKGEYERKIDKYLKKKYQKEEVELDEAAGKITHYLAKKNIDYHKDYMDREGFDTRTRSLPKTHSLHKTHVGIMATDSPGEHGYHTEAGAQPASEYKKNVKALKKEAVELREGRPSQRHPLEGHEYHKKTNAELEYIAKDAHKAAEAMKSHNTTAENKYRDQANDSATVRYFRQKSGMPDWYKKKYGHVKEEVEQLEEKNVPTSPEKWAQAKAQAKSKFDVYPSAYANGWAAKKYKEMGGGWKSVSENTDDPSAAARTLSRKAQIVRDAAKGKKQEQEQASDKFQKDPELSSDIQKT
jgi:predicted RNA binding protein YcfA (HicA-like mRNA interferase family)